VNDGWKLVSDNLPIASIYPLSQLPSGRFTNGTWTDGRKTGGPRLNRTRDAQEMPLLVAGMRFTDADFVFALYEIGYLQACNVLDTGV